jgi:hypothetical protein
MWKNKPPFRLCLNSKASKEIHWHVEHYCGRGVMKKYSSGQELAKDAGFPYETMCKTMATYNGIAAKMMAEEPGAPYDAYGGGKSWDPWGKKYFHNFPVEPTDAFSVAIVTPVIHYCMGGLEIDQYSRVMKGPKAIDGLYAAGEIAGGVHGNNRLGGNSLLDCVVFGRVSGKHCAEYMMGTTVPTSLAELSGEMTAGGVAAAEPVAVPAAATASNKAPLLGKGSHDGQAWGDYPHTTTVNMFTAGWLMVVSFLKEIVFTIFSTIPIEVTGGAKEAAQDFTKLIFAVVFLFLFYNYTHQEVPM